MELTALRIAIDVMIIIALNHRVVQRAFQLSPIALQLRGVPLMSICGQSASPRAMAWGHDGPHGRSPCPLFVSARTPYQPLAFPAALAKEVRFCGSSRWISRERYGNRAHE